MTIQKTKSIQHIEDRMLELDPSSYRYKVLDSAKSFKNSWIELGQYLFSIHKDKLFREWGYLTFEAYCAKEVGIRHTTAVKLLKSYSFLEREEPSFLKQSTVEDKKPNEIPSYEAVNALRLAKTNDRVPEKDYKELRSQVLDEAKDDTEVKKKLKYILKANPKKFSEEEAIDKKDVSLKRTLLSLRNLKSGLQELSFPAKVTKKFDELIDLLEELQR